MDLKGKDSVPDTVHHVVVRVDPDRDEANLMRSAHCQARTDGAAMGSNWGIEEQRAERLKRLKPQVGRGKILGKFLKIVTNILRGY